MTTDAPAGVNVSATAARLYLAMALLLRRTRREVPPQLSLTQISVLGRLARCRAMTATDLAQIESLRPQTIRNLVEDLRDSGLIAGVRDTVDGRRVNLVLTAAGRAVVTGHSAPNPPFLTKALAELSADDRARLMDAIEILEHIAFR